MSATAIAVLAAVGRLHCSQQTVDHTHLIGGTSSARALLARRTLHSCLGPHAFGGMLRPLRGPLHRQGSWLSSHSCGSHSQALHWTEQGNALLRHAAQTPAQWCGSTSMADVLQRCAAPEMAAHKLRSSATCSALRKGRHCAADAAWGASIGSSIISQSIATWFNCKGPTASKPLQLQKTLVGTMLQRHSSLALIDLHV